MKKYEETYFDNALPTRHEQLAGGTEQDAAWPKSDSSEGRAQILTLNERDGLSIKNRRCVISDSGRDDRSP